MGVDKSLLPSKAHLHTKNNNRVIMRTHTHYERSSSPWNRKVLIWLWSFQTIGSIIVTAFAAALLDRRDGLQQRWDDGLADALFLITSFLVFSFTVINVIFTIPAYFHYKKDSLSPMWMMIGSVWMALFWLTVIACLGYRLERTDLRSVRGFMLTEYARGLPVHRRPSLLQCYL